MMSTFRKCLIIFYSSFLLGLIISLCLTRIVHSPGSPLPKLPTILLDPGHGGWDGGTHDNQGFKEKDIVLQFGLLLKADLEKYSFPVHMTRTTDRELSEFAPYQGTRQRTDLLARAQMVSHYNADFLISLHVNAASNRNLCGAITFYQRKSKISKKLAKYIQEAIQQVQPYNQQTILPGNFYLLNTSSVPSVLLEIAFISNPQEYHQLKDQTFLHKMSEAVAKGIYQYIMDTQTHTTINLLKNFSSR